MADTFSNYSTGLESPAVNLQAITPDDAADLPNASRALNAASSGAVRITTIAGDTETIYVAAGIAFPVRAQRVWASGTTATGLVALY